MNPATGAVDKYINLEYYNTSTTVVPVYKTFGAAFLDNKDVYDGKSYFYSAFIMDNKIEMVRVLNSDQPLVDWSQEFYDFSSKESTDFFRLKEP
jgi:hypothetical protein